MAATIHCSICKQLGKVYLLDSGRTKVSLCYDHAKSKGFCAWCDRFAEEILQPTKTPCWASGLCRECCDKQDF